jgi:hypothetical protein
MAEINVEFMEIYIYTKTQCKQKEFLQFKDTHYIVVFLNKLESFWLTHT